MLKIKPGEVSTGKLHAYLLGAIAPRPIAFASTLDKNGVPNLSPFSFFNAFGSNPATLIFSPARRVRDNTIKHTLENIYETKEVVINAVNYEMVHQMSLSSVEFPKGVNEFEKSGFTPTASEIVKPFRVKESPVQMECRVVEVKEMGNEGGAANLIICEMLLMHINENILDAHGRIDPHKIDLVARMGSDFYCRASGGAVFEVAKPSGSHAIGFDSIPERIRMSKVLTGNNLGQLGNAASLPAWDEVSLIRQDEKVREVFERFQLDEESMENHLHLLAKDFLEEGRVADAWKILLLPDFHEQH
ncbi:MAG TPA: flavin reductase [Bacteroidetes bacterium]|nr:flavin reductase [Bacteroidota bacterium]